MTRTTPTDSETRFAFGANWARFLQGLTPSRIEEAQQSLRDMLGVESLSGRRFLDIGSGSGLFSLAARRLGAEVVSFDFDQDSVACAEELKRRFFPADPCWTIAQGSVLDGDFMNRLGLFDVVYSWGVLHHTGDMWRAIDQAAARVRPGGQMFIAIYNDQGVQSVWWTRVKRTYNVLPTPIRQLYLLGFAAALEVAAAAAAFGRLEPARFVRRWTQYHTLRGMSRWHDTVDWVGGYPFEVARPEEVFEFCRERGFRLRKLKTCGGRMGCNEFIFDR